MAGSLLLSSVILVSAMITCLFFQSQAEIRSVEKIKMESLKKDETIDLLGKEIQNIRKQQEGIDQTQNEIKKLMGIMPEAQVNAKPSRGTIVSEMGGAENEAEDILSATRSIKREINRQENEINSLLSEVSQRGTYYRSRPNQWPIKGEISSPYGWRKSPFRSRKTSFHDGIDIVQDLGTEVLTAGDGKVIFAGWKAVYGKTVEIDHGYGFISRYGHNSVILVNEGDRVQKGEAIACLGNTGNSTGPHLHFTIMKNNESENPENYLP
ncbi:MAG: peptidoglycan DD-metalloendopeptidase family protein [Syntrophomonas sp.]|uniref:M23 family metallopeptidase n=1 Tax=Syntrophomonas sp. TaxID=2053627 RepID=UPI0026297A33|nr:M23 family metallopeptidase [Syntrophomonas sp.]MDD2510580.1 peptidoglycan DD-metalloendopeptidase family protein [Syntrophomonas sp.]MDD3880468.1 peptidoglycan DD-metalloendopeptidase family protein [Syntrophomonas sp.]MDD4626299.1 peptidoglycan DD-metalloendopeptidase family protein [Syntrophomonas sp.]